MVTNPAPSASVPSVTIQPSTQTGAPQVTVPNASSTSGSTVLPDAAGQASAEEEPFTLPGQKLSVIPIGLGVLGGISAVALIVVGLVTYERTKYRKVRLFLSIRRSRTLVDLISFRRSGNVSLRILVPWASGGGRLQTLSRLHARGLCPSCPQLRNKASVIACIP